MEALQDVALALLGEIDEDVAAEDDVETPQRGEVVEQVELAETHLAAEFGLHLNAALVVVEEEAPPLRHGEAARGGHATVTPGARLGQRRRRDVGAQHLPGGAGRALAALLRLVQGEQDAVGLLPGGDGGRPDAHAAAGVLGQQGFHQDAVMRRIAEPEGLVGGHGVHHRGVQGAVGAGRQARRQGVEVGQAVLAQQVPEAAHHQVFLADAEADARLTLEKIGDRLILACTEATASVHGFSSLPRVRSRPRYGLRRHPPGTRRAGAGVPAPSWQGYQAPTWAGNRWRPPWPPCSC